MIVRIEDPIAHGSDEDHSTDSGQRNPARQSRREDMQRLLTQLRAEPFDAAAFAQTMAEQEARMLRQLQLGQEVLQELVLAMSPEDRRGFADRLEAGLRGDRSKEARGHGD